MTATAKQHHVPPLDQGDRDDLQDLASQVDLYHLFGLAKTAPLVWMMRGDIKRAYHKLALRYHPDKVAARHGGKNASSEAHHLITQAKEEFQRISRYYAILSDPVTRARYDTTGRIDETNDMSSPEEWSTFLHDLYGSTRLSKDAIATFAVTYKGSAEEEEDVKAAYAQYGHGAFWSIFDAIPLLELNEVERLLDMLARIAPAGSEPVVVDKKQWTARKREAKREAALFAQFTAAIQEDGGEENEEREDLSSILAKRGRARMEDLVAGIEEKYAKSGSSKGKKPFSKKAKAPPTEEEFAAIQARLSAKKKASS